MIRIPLLFCDSKVPLVCFGVADKKYYAIIDTGSEISMYDFSMKNLFDMIQDLPRSSCVGINGRAEFNASTVLAGSIILNEKEFKLNGLLYNLIQFSHHFKDDIENDIEISAIIGSDFLKKYNAVIDFDNKELILSYD